MVFLWFSTRERTTEVTTPGKAKFTWGTVESLDLNVLNVYNIYYIIWGWVKTLVPSEHQNSW